MPTSACSSASSGRRPSIVTVTQVPGHRLLVPGGEQPRRIGHLDDAVLGHLEAADLVGRPEPVLGRPDHPEAGVPVTLEGQHHIDQMLQQPRTGDGPVLGDVPDDDHRHVAPLGHPDQGGRHLADLGDSTRRAVGLGRADGLHRVDHQQRRAGPPRRGRGRCRDRSPPPGRARRPARRCVRRAAGPGRRTPRPSRTRCRAAGLGPARGHLEQQGRLARPPAHRPAARQRRAPARRRAPGPARRPRCGPGRGVGVDLLDPGGRAGSGRRP